ncbi:MAG: hypothetical protein WDN04_08415 [Rhodospirillales bacterium]
MATQPNVKPIGQSGNTPAPSKVDLRYVPSFQQILEVLAVTQQDLSAKSVPVPVDGLKYLISEMLRHVYVDEVWYVKRYPDVAAAILSGDMASAAAHFRISGYFEGRLPAELPFDPKYYIQQYSDLSSVFTASDDDALRHHYETKGYYEGRAGVPTQFTDAERWRSAPRDR